MLHCDKCKKWDENRRKLHGCLGPTPAYLPIYEVEELELKIHECPGRTITPYTKQLLSLYGMCEALHCLPEAGGFLDQASDIMHAFRVIKTVESLVMDKQKD